MAEAEGGSEQDDVSFLRTDDMVCLQCTGTGERVCLAAEGFGNRHCYLENIADKNFPPEMTSCVFVIEQALSVRALQEMVTAASSEQGQGTQSGHRTLLYGHAVLLRHQYSNMYLACLSTSSSNDKLAFDVGLQEHSQGESCWWTIHPASKQRSEGEKVRVGDDLILVSVATERYLHTAREGQSTIVNASFHLTHWSVAPFGTGASRVKSVGYVFGGEVLRFFHGGDECLTIPPTWTDAPGQNMIVYEGGAVLSQARSLWRLELVRTKWAGGFVNWGYPLRVTHITTGRYMGFNENREVVLVARENATVAATAFCLRHTKDDKKIVLDEKEEEVIGSPLIKYGDTTVFLQHLETGLWLSYKTYETKKRGVGKVEEKQAIMSEEGKMDDGLEFSRSQEEESKTARVIRKCGALFNKFITGLDCMQNQNRGNAVISSIDQEEMVHCLEDLIDYFAQPEEDIEHEEKQNKLKALRNRQDLFQEEGILNLILETIDKINVMTSQGYLVAVAGEDTSQNWDAISSYLYQLLAAVIKGNHTNCAQFAQSNRLDWLFSRLGSQQAAEGTGMLDVLHCVLIDSPEALNMMKEEHIKVIISLLEKHGRDPKVLDVLCSLCVGNGVAVRSSQNNICDNLLPQRNLLLQTKLVDHVASMHPNMYVGKVDGSAMFRRWYFEAMVDHSEVVTHLEPHFRVGWANTKGYVPYPGGGSRWGGNGVGDCIYSFGFDGVALWTGGRSNAVRQASVPYIQKGDVIGCILDLNVPIMLFTVNGVRVKGCFRNFNTDGMFYPVISLSAKLSCRFMFGGDQGKLRYGPPENFSPLVECLLAKQVLTVEPCFQFGEVNKGVFYGLAEKTDDTAAFVPTPIDTTMVTLPSHIENIRDKLAENIHEVWAMNKIDAGWSYGEIRNDNSKVHPCLTAFDRLPTAEKKYDTDVALQTLKTIVALNYHITMDKPPARIKTIKLHNDPYLQSNGYKPAPLDLSAISLNQKMETLVDMLSENTHNLWAQERIQQSWTYGLSEENKTKRSPHLVPYKSVDDVIKKANRDTATETVRTLLAYGYVLEPPAADTGEGTIAQVQTKSQQRTYRAEKTYAVTSGKWYFECEIMTPGPVKIGWAAMGFNPYSELGGDEFSYAYDGYLGRKSHAGNTENYGKQWQVGDVIGCLLDLYDRTISFSLNGELVLDSVGGETAFNEIPQDGYVPAFTLGTMQRTRLCFGQDINALKYFTLCGLQEGYQPFCVNMNRMMTFWYNKDEASFMNVDDVNSATIEILRVPAGSDTAPALKISHKLFESMEKVSWEYLRLSLPVTCSMEFIDESEKELRWQEIRHRQRREQAERAGIRHPANLEHHMLKSGFSMADVKAFDIKSTNQVDTLKMRVGRLSEVYDLQRHYSEDAAEVDETGMPRTGQRLTPGTAAAAASVGAALGATLGATLSPTMTSPQEGMSRRPSTRGTLTKTQSFDMATLAVPGEGGKLRSSASEENLHKAERRKSVTHQEPMSDPEDRHKKRGKSPFRFFSKKKEADARVRGVEVVDQHNVVHLDLPPERSKPLSAPRNASVRLAGSSLHIVPPSVPERPTSMLLSPGGGGDIGPPLSPRRLSKARLEELPPQIEGDFLDVNSLALVEEYFYGIRIFPGQDPNHVYCGWVRTTFHSFEKSFDMNKVRKVVFHSVRDDGYAQEILERQNCYMVCAGQLLGDGASGSETSGRNSSQGMYVGCHVDISTGIITFTADGKPTKFRFKMEPGTKLYPAAFFEATSTEVLQFELGRTQTTLPLSAALLHSTDKHLTPQCPPRLKVQCLQPFQWARVPNQSLKPHALKLSEVRGWSMLCEDAVSMLAVHIPEEDRCIDALELIENDRLLTFHAHTLGLYGALCFQGNQRVAHIICSHVDAKQLMYAICAEYMSGPLRNGLADLLIALHLEFHAYARSLTQNEFIVPLGGEIKAMYEDPISANSISTQQSVSIRPQMTMCETPEKIESIKNLSTPYFPMDILKQFVMEALDDAVRKGNRPLRDPIGGSTENLFVPLLKLADKLLLVGLLDDSDLEWLLRMIDPENFDAEYDPEAESKTKGLMQMKLDEGVKLEMCHLLHHLCDVQLRHRVESIIAFSDDFVAELQTDQLRRYNEIKQSDLPSAVAAKKTREFRCAPKEQMRFILAFKNLEDENLDQCVCGEHLRDGLSGFHEEIVKKLRPAEPEEEPVPEGEEPPAEPGIGGAVVAKPSTPRKPWTEKLFSLVKLVKSSSDENAIEPEESIPTPEEIFMKKIRNTVVSWAEESEIENSELVRQMFSLLLRTYNGIGEIMNALENTYVISNRSKTDVIQLLQHLGKVRALLPVQMGPEEEEIMRISLWAMVNNRVFFQHPDLIRILRVHENVMDVMMNTLGKHAQAQTSSSSSQPAAAPSTNATSPTSPAGQSTAEATQDKDTSHEMVVACCRFLCYFCRTSRQNQKAMFDHLLFLLENSNILLSRPSLRGSTPLDVAYSSLMENTELALAMREHYLEKIAVYLSRCGLQSNQELIDKGYPDVGWDPVEGERYLDFLRFCVWVNGESVEENANLVIRLLIRRPECLGPALRGEGQGLFAAIKDAIKMSERIQAEKEASPQSNGDAAGAEEDEDYVDMGAAVLNFYCVLVDLLGRCAPEAATIAQGKNECIRARAILRSLVPMEDLEGVLGLRFNLQNPQTGKNGEHKSDLPTGLLPNHKQSIVMFLERVYGIETQEVFFRLLENGFLPDLRAATMLERKDGSESDMSLALNRYIGNSILPILIKYCNFFANADNYANLLDATLHTVYRLSKVKILTKGQREKVSDFLVALTHEMQPGMLLRLLRKLTVDVAVITEYTTVALRLLTLHYERCARYYCVPGGQGSYGAASEEEKRLTMMLFTNIFESLAKMEYDPELFNKSLPCLTAIACALPPDYSLTTGVDDEWYKQAGPTDGPYIPEPVHTSGISLPNELNNITQKFAEHYHDAWASRKFEHGWSYGEYWSDERKTHPRLKPYNMLNEWEKERYQDPIRESLKALVALSWKLELSEGGRTTIPKSQPGAGMSSVHSYSPQPVDMSTLTLSRELQNMSERLAENAHDNWAKKMMEELEAVGGGIHPQLVPYDLLTDKEKRKNRERSQELLKFMQYEGFRIYKIPKKQQSEVQLDRVSVGGGERRFIASILEKMLQYLDVAAISMKALKPSANYSRRSSFKTSSRDVKFFSKVVLPLMEKYLPANQWFFLSTATATSNVGSATVREKEMVAMLFCRLAGLLRSKLGVFGTEAKISVRCLQVLIKSSDARTLVKSCPDFVKTSMLTFFNNSSEDLAQTVVNLQTGRFSHLRGTTMKVSSSLNYIQLVLIPVLTTLFDHLAANEFGSDILLNDIQVACYKILNSLYTLGTNPDLSNSRHRVAVGNCLGAFASCFPVAFLEPHLNKHNQFSIHGKLEDQSLEAQAIMSEMESSMPTLDDLMGQVEKFVSGNGKYLESPHIIDIMLPMLCSYLPFWWSQGPDNVNPTGGNHVTMVTSDHLNTLFKNVLFLVKKNVGVEGAPWMISIAANAGQIIINSSEDLLYDPILPLAEKVCSRAEAVFHKEDMMRGYLKSTTEDTSQAESELQEEFSMLARDIYAFYPLLIKYVDLQRAFWLKQNVKEAEEVYHYVARIFDIWSRSQFFRREEQNYISQHEIDNMALIMPAAAGRGRSNAQNLEHTALSSKKVKKKRDGKRDKEKELAASLMVACLKRLLPVGLNLFAGREQELVQHAKEKFLKKEPDTDIFDYVKLQLTLPDKIDPSDAMSWQHYLYSKLGSRKSTGVSHTVSADQLVERIIDMAKVLYGLHMIDHPTGSSKGQLRTVVSTQRKRAVIACFRQTSLHSCQRLITLSEDQQPGLAFYPAVERGSSTLACEVILSIKCKENSLWKMCNSLISSDLVDDDQSELGIMHRAINIFMRIYCELWLDDENTGQEQLVENITQTFEDAEKQRGQEVEEKPDPLKQQVLCFCRAATTEHRKKLKVSGGSCEDNLYMEFAIIFSKSCGGAEEEEEEEGGDDEAGPSIHEQEMEKQKLLFQQHRLSDRGVAEMILLYISACKGQQGPMVMTTLKLGISILKGGNVDVQMRMLKHLRDKKDVGFFTSIAGLMNSLSVLDLDAFERTQKAEGLGVGSEGTAGEKNMHDAEFTCAIFRFLQLLCEGHNLDFQNYLRTQAGNTTTVNVVISTVDYLLRLQESIMDFYWHYSSKELIDQPGKDNFCKAIGVAKQVFSTLTEFIQGPCSLNQQALAHSRLWDAVGGFMFLFAHMQDKLSKNSSQLDLLLELLELQKEMVIMMLSMLEGNVMNGTIGKQMVDTLVESASNVEILLRFFNMFLKLQSVITSPVMAMILKFFDMFLKLNATSTAFKEIDTKKIGWITPKEFQKAMEQQKIYSSEEISYLMSCCEPNHDGLIDYTEFTERFHNPAKDIGFNLAVLLTNLSEHMPNDPRLSRFLETASSVLNYFEPFLGRIEIMGSSKRIERVYFEVKESTIDQWEKPQIKESKRAFFYSIVTEGGDKEKLEAFVNFCEDAIFEMKHASSISMEDSEEGPPRASEYPFPGAEEEPKPSTFEPLKKMFRFFKNCLVSVLSCFKPSNIRHQWGLLMQKTYLELFIGFFKLAFYSVFYGFWSIYYVSKAVMRGIILLMSGHAFDRQLEEVALVPTTKDVHGFYPHKPLPMLPAAVGPSGLEGTELALMGDGTEGKLHAFGIDITREEDGGEIRYQLSAAQPQPQITPQSSLELSEGELGSEEENKLSPGTEKVMTDGEVMADGVAGAAQLNHVSDGDVKSKEAVPLPAAGDPGKAAGRPSAQMMPMMSPPEPPKPHEPTPHVTSIDLSEYAQKFVSFLARNFYTMKYVALVMAFCINFMLLFYKVTSSESDEDPDDDDNGGGILEGAEELMSDLVEEASEVVSNITEHVMDAVEEMLSGEGGGGDDDDEGPEEDVEEWVIIEERVFYLEPIMCFLAFLHSCVSFCMLIAYYHLKVPLAIFKREKEIARQLEFEGLFISDEAAEDDIKGHWDKLVISTRSFPVNYWDKFVKKRVREKYCETYDYDAISKLLGMDKGGGFAAHEETTGFFSFITKMDWKYQVWKAGVTITDNSFLYNLWYFTFSVMGNFNHFFFAAHLLDVAVGFKTLRTILQSVTHNGKQLVLTVMLLTIIVYIYTVIAFNFFRKFYVQEEDEQIDQKCHDMLTCFVFHLYKGVRAGGGIGDEIGPPDGDDYEVYRIIFDITFFFFVIVILLAIIQGLIIDAFGELRDQLQSVVEDMESNCFICGIGKDYFDKVPHGFDTHVAKEHNLANYMFFLMHLINKPDTEYTGQETYVWELYQKRCWDFFPVGDCFRKQYEDELMGTG